MSKIKKMANKKINKEDATLVFVIFIFLLELIQTSILLVPYFCSCFYK